jgi:hypothetical protein
LRVALLLWMGVFGLAAAAGAVTVRANLTRGITVIGDPVELRVTVSGARNVTEASDVEVAGLDVTYQRTGTSAVAQFNNGVFTSERVYTIIYRVIAEKNGTFTLPGVTVVADGKSYRTEPVSLTVQPSTATTGKAGEAEPISFAEFVIPKKAAYIGEAIPLELRLYVDARVVWQATAMPEVSGEGFTKAKFPEPQRDEVQKNGREYDLLTFKTVISPSQAGKITIGPSEVSFTARVPRARKGGARSLLDMFDDDIFGSATFSSTQQMKAKAGPIELTVKPLPVEGKPADFSGAVGNFQFTAEGSPKLVKIDDPLTMKLQLTGRGNFDRMTAPVLVDPTGWRTYPPSSAFKASDEVGYAGTKTFEMAVVPETKKTAMPVFAFSYFDPLAEKYVSLRSEPAALTVEGSAAPEAPKPVVSVPGDSPKAPTPPAATKPTDILGPIYEKDTVTSSVPLVERKDFWIAQAAMGVSLLAFVGLRLRRQPDEAARTAAKLRQEKAAAMAHLRDAQIGQVDFFETAARVAQIETALATGKNAGSVDAAAVHAVGALSEETRGVIDEVFSSRAELLYAGGGRSEGTVSVEERERVLGALRELERSYGRS